MQIIYLQQVLYMDNIEQHPANVTFNLFSPRNQSEQDTLDFEITLAQCDGHILSMDIYESIVSIMYLTYTIVDGRLMVSDNVVLLARFKHVFQCIFVVFTYKQTLFPY